MEMNIEELEHLKNSKSNYVIESVDESIKVVISENMRRMQKRMKEVFEKQKLAGGIIDEQEVIVLTVRKILKYRKASHLTKKNI